MCLVTFGMTLGGSQKNYNMCFAIWKNKSLGKYFGGNIFCINLNVYSTYLARVIFNGDYDEMFYK